MNEVMILLTMGFFGIMVIHTSQLRLAIVYLAVFSLLASLLYVMYSAPELAIAEGVIGSGLVTLLYLAALKKNRVYTIGVVSIPEKMKLKDRYMTGIEGSAALREIRKFFVRREVEVQVVFLDLPLEQAILSPAYDLVLCDTGSEIIAYTYEDNYIMVELELMFQLHGTDSVIRFERSAREMGP